MGERFEGGMEFFTIIYLRKEGKLIPLFNFNQFNLNNSIGLD
jgi:hypothetical protein